MRPFVTLTSLLALATLAVAVPCAAQVDLTPFAGVYPQASIQSGSTSILCDFGRCASTPALSQNDAVVGGVRLTSWIGKRVALDLSAGHWGSGLGGGVSDITTGTFGVLYNLTSPDRAGFFVVGGVAFVALAGSAFSPLGYGSCKQVAASLVTCSGSAYAIAPDQTDWGPVLGVGARIRFVNAVGLRVEVEDHVYWLTGLGPFANSPIEHALVFSVGPSVTLGARRTRPSDLSGVANH